MKPTFFLDSSHVQLRTLSKQALSNCRLCSCTAGAKDQPNQVRHLGDPSVLYDVNAAPHARFPPSLDPRNKLPNSRVISIQPIIRRPPLIPARPPSSAREKKSRSFL